MTRTHRHLFTPHFSVQSTHPCILANFEQFQRTVSHKRVVVFLDYDGTLTPIVSNPDEAFMSPAMRATVRSLAELFPTAIISGRGRSKVEGFVQLPELFYAGSHGLDIKGPVVRTPVAAQHRIRNVSTSTAVTAADEVPPAPTDRERAHGA